MVCESCYINTLKIRGRTKRSLVDRQLNNASGQDSRQDRASIDGLLHFPRGRRFVLSLTARYYRKEHASATIAERANRGFRFRRYAIHLNLTAGKVRTRGHRGIGLAISRSTILLASSPNVFLSRLRYRWCARLFVTIQCHRVHEFRLAVTSSSSSLSWSELLV